MKTYYINKVNLPESNWNCSIIGLFTNENWTGEGSFCGWYGVEYYNNTTLLAIGYQKEKNIGGKIYNPKNKFTDTKIIKKEYDKIIIGSIIWTKKIYAENDEQAIKIFFEQSWED